MAIVQSARTGVPPKGVYALIAVGEENGRAFFRRRWNNALMSIPNRTQISPIVAEATRESATFSAQSA